MDYRAGRGYIRGMRPSDLPLHYKVAMIAAYLVGTVGIFLVANFVFREMLPPVIAAILGAGIFGFLLGYAFRDHRLAAAAAAAARAAPVSNREHRPEVLNTGHRRLR